MKKWANGRVEYGLPIRVEETKTVGDAWEVAGYCSTFGDLDRVGDIVLPGAFTKTLAQGDQTLFLYCHKIDQMLGVPLSLHEDQRGLFGRFRISRTPLGETVHTLMEDGAPYGFSIGFIPEDHEYDGTGNRLLKQIDLVENTLAPAPLLANPEAQVTAFKTLYGFDLDIDSFDPSRMPFDAAWTALTDLLTKGVQHAKALHARRGADGRGFGPRHTEALAIALEALEGASSEVKALLDRSPVEVEAPPVEHEVASSEVVVKATPEEVREVQHLKADLWRRLESYGDLLS